MPLHSPGGTGVAHLHTHTEGQQRKDNDVQFETSTLKCMFRGHAHTPHGIRCGESQARALSSLIETYQCLLEVSGVCMEDLDAVVAVGGGEALAVTREGHGDGRLGRTGTGHNGSQGVTRAQASVTVSQGHKVEPWCPDVTGMSHSVTKKTTG